MIFTLPRGIIYEIVITDYCKRMAVNGFLERIARVVENGLNGWLATDNGNGWL